MKRLTLSLLLIGLSLPTVSAQNDSEPNTSAAELSFKVIKSRRIDWTVSDSSGKNLFVNPDVNIPPYVAELWLHKAHLAYGNKHALLECLKMSPVMQELSKRQRDFLDTGYAIWVDNTSEHLPEKFKPKPDFFPTWLYAFSQKDAQNMVRAYLDELNRRVAHRIDSEKRELVNLQQAVQQAQQALTPKQKEKDSADEELQQLKQIRYEFDTHPDRSAKETLKEMRDALDKLDIELTGIREKLKSIEAFRKETGRQSLSPQVQIKLDEMYIELMIELSGLEARRALTKNIQDQETGFLNLFYRVCTLGNEVGELITTIEGGQNMIASTTRRLENPSFDSLPPKVHKNTVRIYRIIGSYAPEDVQTYIKYRKVWLKGKSHHFNDVRNYLSEVQHFLDMIDSRYLQVEPQLVEALKAIRHQLRVLDVNAFLPDIENIKDRFIRDLPLSNFKRQFPMRMSYTAREYLTLVEKEQLQLDPSDIKRLRYIANDLPRELLESGLQMAENMPTKKHYSPGRHRTVIQNLELFQQQIEQDGLKLDPSLAKKIDDCLKKYEAQSDK